MLSASFCAGDLAGGGGTEKGLDLLLVLIVRACQKFCLNMIHWKIKLGSISEF